MKVKEFVDKSESKLTEQFKRCDEIALYNQEKVLKAFQKYAVGQRHLSQTNG